MVFNKGNGLPVCVLVCVCFQEGCVFVQTSPEYCVFKLKYGHKLVIYHYPLVLNTHTSLKHTHCICVYEVYLFQQYLIAHPVH